MQFRTEVIEGRKRIIITKTCNGNDKTLEAVAAMLKNDFKLKEGVINER